MPKLEVWAEIGGDGACLLFTFDPPGLLARGASLESALAEAVVETGRLRELLVACGQVSLLKESWDEGESPELVIRETMNRRGKVATGDTEAAFSRDLEPLRPEEIVAYLALMTQMRLTLLALRDGLSREAYLFRSKPKRMPIGAQLRHVAHCERWYLGRFWSDVEKLPRRPDVWDKLAQCRELVVRRMSDLTPEERAATRKAGGEIWTARKLFRRFLYHEKFHRDTVARDLTLYLAQTSVGR
jgi:hypothetical protein